MNIWAPIKILVIMQLKYILGQSRALMILFISAIPILLLFLLNQAGGNIESVHLIALYFFYVLIIPILLSILYNGSFIQAELEAKTLTYLFIRPTPRWVVLIGQYLGVTLALCACMSVSLVAAWFTCSMIGGPGLLFDLWQLTMLALLGYGAIFIFLGLLFPKRSTVVGLVYGLIVEGLISFVPAIVNTLTISYYLRSRYIQSAGSGDKDLLKFTEDYPHLIGNHSFLLVWLIVIIMVAIFTFLSSLIISGREFNGGTVNS